MSCLLFERLINASTCTFSFLFSILHNTHSISLLPCCFLPAYHLPVLRNFSLPLSFTSVLRPSHPVPSSAPSLLPPVLQNSSHPLIHFSPTDLSYFQVCSTPPVLQNIPHPLSLLFSLCPSMPLHLTYHISPSRGQVRPHMELTFENILSHINTIYVLCALEGLDTGTRDEQCPDQGCLRLKVRRRREMKGGKDRRERSRGIRERWK